MVGEGWADFHRDLHTEMRFDALVMDVRATAADTSPSSWWRSWPAVIGWENGRGIGRCLTRRTAARPGRHAGRRVRGSDGDIITAAVKLLGLVLWSAPHLGG